MTPDILIHTQGMTENQRLMFMAQYGPVAKNPQSAFWLTMLLGGFGAHKFLLGKNGVGVLYLLFSLTFIPAFIAIFESFGMPAKVNAWNAQQAQVIAAQVRQIVPGQPSTVPAAVPPPPPGFGVIPPGPPAGWQPDPAGIHELRYWDGTKWTSHVSNGGVQAVSPP
jgi:TM2 domain-containing membrane protein YozV